MKIKVKKPTQQYLNDCKVTSWAIWEKEVSRFDWHYDKTEECFLLRGKVVVETKEGKVEFGAGDLVTFPAGLSCVWDIKEPVRKHYNFPEEYGPHPNPDLQRLFREKPWQGQKPEHADIIFLALNANYSPCVNVSLIQPYHEDGVGYWKEKKVHHPFLTEQYTGTDGKKFHQTFAIMEMDSRFADYLSFIELLHYPTVGSRGGANVTYSSEHLKWVDSIISKAKITFILSGETSGVYPEMLKIRSRHRVFKWLPNSLRDSEEVLPVLYKNELTTMYMPYHFSSQGKHYNKLIKEQLPLMSKIIKACVLQR